MNRRLRTAFAFVAHLLLAYSVAMLAGCSLHSFTDVSQATGTQITATAHIQGRVHGGVFPIQGAWIELWQTGTGAWNSTTGSYAPSTLNTSTNSNFIAYTKSAVANDGSGLAPGSFDFGSASLNCTSGSYLYLTTTGGHTLSNTSTENDNVVQVAVIGKCGTDLGNVNVYISELSSVAAAYTLGSFISVDADPITSLQRVNITAPSNNTATGGCTVSGTTLTACTGAGLAHGFSNAANLVDSTHTDGSYPTGAANSTFAANTAAIAPQALLNTIGNILQACVDSGPSTTGSLSSSCTNLFGNSATGYNSDTKASGAPTNTMQASLNMARNPTTKVSALYALQTTNPPFTPGMASAPTSFLLSVLYPAAAVGDLQFASPTDVALDAKDNVYVAYNGTGTGVLAGLTANGSLTFGGASPSTTTIANPGTLAVDTAGNVWLADNTANLLNLLAVGNVYGFQPNGTYYNTYKVPFGHAAAVAFDNAGNFFVGRDSTDVNITAFQYAANTYTYSQAGTKTGVALLRAAIDSYGSFRAVGSTTFLSWTPTASSCTSKYSESSVTLDKTLAMAMAVDNRNYTTFIASSKQLTTAVTLLSGNCTSSAQKSYNGNKTLTSTDSNAAALDGSGNLFWDTPTGILYVYQGAESYEGSSGSTMGGTVVGVTPCFLASGATACTSPSKAAGLAVDSSGAMWFGAAVSGGTAYLVQNFGLASPSFPLLAYEKSGVSF